MRAARKVGADLIHFSEGALSGYVKRQIQSWEQVDWVVLDDELKRTVALAGELGLWTVIGANHRLAAPYRPHNSLYVISNEGRIQGRYDKRFCSNTEINSWYTPGTQPYIFEVKGSRFGCAICIEIQFAEVFMEYLELGVDCLLFSTYSEDPMFVVQAQGYAASHNFWFSVANPVAASRGLPSTLVGPSGQIVTRCRKNTQTFALSTLDKGAPEWNVALNKARPWRALAREGSIYRSQLASQEYS